MLPLGWATVALAQSTGQTGDTSIAIWILVGMAVLLVATVAWWFSRSRRA